MATVQVALLAETRALRAGLDQANSQLSGFGKSASKMGGLLKGAFVAAGAAMAGGQVVSFLSDATNAASDLQESVSKTGVIFGPASKAIIDFSKGAATSLGQTQQQALDAASTFATFGKAAGLAGKDLSDFAIQNTNLASDLASFHNTSPEEAIQAIGAALRGETEPIRKYGVMLDDASLRQEALRQGLIKTTTQALTPQQKTLAAQALILKQTKDAQGDFARTSGGLANQQRILSAQWQNMKAQLGTALLPIITKVVTFLNNNMAPAFAYLQRTIPPVVARIKNFFSGLDSGQQTSGIVQWIKGELLPGIQGLVDAYKNFATAALPIIMQVYNAFKSTWSKIQPQVSSVINSIKSIVLDGLAIVTNIWNKAAAVMTAVWDKFGANILQFLTSTFQNLATVLQGAFQIVKGIFKTALSLLKGDWKGAWKGIQTILKGVWNVIKGLVRQALNVVRFAIKNAWTAVKVLTSAAWNGIKALLGKAWSGIKSLAGKAWDGLKNLIGKGWDAIKSATGKAWDGIKNAVSTGIRNLLQKAGDIPGDLKDKLSDAAQWLVETGKNVVEGLWAGIQGMGDWLEDKVWDWVKSVLPGPVEKALGINSPSRVFAAIGRYSVLGLAQGLGDRTANARVSSAARRMLDGMRFNTRGVGFTNAAKATVVVNNTFNVPANPDLRSFGRLVQESLDAYLGAGGARRA